MWSYWAAIRGYGGLVGLQQQLHPEVHNVLFGIFHLGQFGKLPVQDERLHDGGHKPGRRQIVSTQTLKLNQVAVDWLIPDWLRTSSSSLTISEARAGRVFPRPPWFFCARWTGCWLRGRSRHPSSPSSSPGSPSAPAGCSESRLAMQQTNTGAPSHYSIQFVDHCKHCKIHTFFSTLFSKWHLDCSFMTCLQNIFDIMCVG